MTKTSKPRKKKLTVTLVVLGLAAAAVVAVQLPEIQREMKMIRM